MRGSVTMATALASALALAGCASNGVLLVRGVVTGPGAVGPEPLGGVAVQARDGRDGAPRYLRVLTRDDGAYRLDYPYSGTWFPLFAPKGGDPHLEFSAPGWQPRVVRLRGGKEEGVARGASGPYLKLDVTLVPEPAAGRKEAP